MAFIHCWFRAPFYLFEFSKQVYLFICLTCFLCVFAFFSPGQAKPLQRQSTFTRWTVCMDFISEQPQHCYEFSGSPFFVFRTIPVRVSRNVFYIFSWFCSAISFADVCAMCVRSQIRFSPSYPQQFCWQRTQIKLIHSLQWANTCDCVALLRTQITSFCASQTLSPENMRTTRCTCVACAPIVLILLDEKCIPIAKNGRRSGPTSTGSYGTFMFWKLICASS